ncbi:MAG: hypothetical protein ABIR71_11745 [Chthoniobacterales bacterium]
MKSVFLCSCLFAATALAQHTPEPNSDVSDKALLARPAGAQLANQRAAAAALRKLAEDYYAWRNENYPVRSSDAGLHTWDDRLTDFLRCESDGAHAARESAARKSARDENR